MRAEGERELRVELDQGSERLVGVPHAGVLGSHLRLVVGVDQPGFRGRRAGAFVLESAERAEERWPEAATWKIIRHLSLA